MAGFEIFSKLENIMSNKIFSISFFLIFISSFLIVNSHSFAQSSSINYAKELRTTTNNFSTEKVKVTDKVITEISDGDFVYPIFSPNGKFIAFSKVVLKKVDDHFTEFTEIHLYNLKNRKKSVLLDAKTSENYATYKSFVTGLEWVGNKKLIAYISDGDVDSTELTFNIKNKKILSEKFSSFDGIELGEIYNEELKDQYLLLTKSFPEIPKEVALTAFNMWQAFEIKNKGLVAQFSYYKYSPNIWYFDFEKKKKTLLLGKPTEAKKFSLNGAFNLKDVLFFLITKDNFTEFYTYKNGKTQQIAKTNLQGSFDLKYFSPQKAIFLLKQPNYQSDRESSLWVFDGEKLQQATDVEKISDVNIDNKGKKIAFSYWVENKKRHVLVKTLKKNF